MAGAHFPLENDKTDEYVMLCPNKLCTCRDSNYP